MRFTKMHGCGNDYVFIDLITNPLQDEEKCNLSRLAAQISDRRNGVGGDGMILILPSLEADFRMEMYNSDGSIGEMCGNGIRCLGKYVYDYHLTDKKEISVMTRAGIKYLEFHLQDGCVDAVRVNMGKPISEPSQIPVDYDGEQQILVDYELMVGGIIYPITCVSMGNPHAVIFVPDIMKEDVKFIGRMIEHHKFFPNRTNVEFVHVIGRDEIEMRVWERGAGETYACGTGACASVMAAIMHDYCDNRVLVHLLGGDLLIEYEKEKDLVFMTGPAVAVYDGDTIKI